MNKMIVAATAAIALAGCVGLSTTEMLGDKTLVLTPQILASSYQTQADVHLWVQADVASISLTLKDAGVTKATKNIASGSFAVPVNFSNLKNGKTYTVLAKAFTTGNAQISDDASSSLTITVGTDTAANMNGGVIPVALNTVSFSAGGSANIGITDGHYTYPGNETM